MNHAEQAQEIERRLRAENEQLRSTLTTAAAGLDAVSRILSHYIERAEHIERADYADDFDTDSRHFEDVRDSRRIAGEYLLAINAAMRAYENKEPRTIAEVDAENEQLRYELHHTRASLQEYVDALARYRNQLPESIYDRLDPMQERARLCRIYPQEAAQ